jgi:hypothetical protein
MMMRAILLSFFAFIFIFFSATTAFNYWNESQNEIQFNNINQLAQTVDIVNLTAPTGKTLVPMGAVLGINDVDNIEYHYIVKTTQEGNISVQAKNVTLTNNGNSYSGQNILLFTYKTQKIDDTHQDVLVNISMQMPKNESQYNILRNSSISLQLEFSLI